MKLKTNLIYGKLTTNVTQKSLATNYTVATAITESAFTSADFIYDINDPVRYGGYYEALEENINIGEIVSLDVTRSIPVDNFTASDLSVLAIGKITLDTVSVSEIIAKDINIVKEEHGNFDYFESGYAEDPYLADFLTKDTVDLGISKAIPIETFAPTDTISKAFSKIIVDQFSFSDALMEIVYANDNDDFNLSDIISNNVGKVFTDTLSPVLDQVVTGVGKNFNETCSASDNSVNAIGKNIQDNISNTDAINYNVSKNIADTASIGDSVITLLSFIRGFIDTLNSSDLISFVLGKVFSDTLSTADTVKNDIGKFINDSTSTSDSVSSNISTSKSDTSTTIDNISIQFSASRIIADTLAGTDVIKYDVNKNIIETLSSNDNILLNLSRPFADTSSNSDSILLNPNKITIETIGCSDSISMYFNNYVANDYVTPMYVGTLY
jgi:hypothetical protein